MLTNKFMTLNVETAEYELGATFILYDDLTYEITGPNPDTVMMDYRTYAPTHPEHFILFEDDPIEWARNIKNGYRTHYCYVETIEDTFPPAPTETDQDKAPHQE